MKLILNIWEAFLAIIRQFGITDALDVLLVSFIIYSGIKLIRETRAGQLVKGLIVLLAVWVGSSILQLHMMNTLLGYFFQFAVMALLVVFQPEIRRALEQLGRSGLKNSPWFQFSVKENEETLKQQKRSINAVVDVAAAFQKSKTGALIVFERQTRLGDIIDTGTIVNAIPSEPLIGNVFFNKAPLHDGAMIIRDGMVYAAGCILPLTKKSESVSIELGTRHRAALGMSENSDAVIVVVSEETGQISVAVNGVLTRNYTRETLKSALEGFILPEEAEGGEKRSVRFPSIRRAKKP